jgi:transposase, IS5 family
MPVEVILRMLLCKHLYGWSYEETRERVADNLVLRWFCRVYFQTVPDKSTLIRLPPHAAPRDAACSQ